MVKDAESTVVAQGESKFDKALLMLLLRQNQLAFIGGSRVPVTSVLWTATFSSILQLGKIRERW